MSFLVALPSIHPPSTERCVETMAPVLWDSLVVVDNAHGPNRGVAASWNVGARRVLAEGRDWLVVCSGATRFGPAGGADLAALLAATDPAATWVVEAEAPVGWHLIAWSARLLASVGLFDENYWPAYCLTPETPVLTANLRWVPIGTVEVGTNLVGVEEFPSPEQMCSRRECDETARARGLCLLHYQQVQRTNETADLPPVNRGKRGPSRSYCASTVTGVSRRHAEVLRLTMVDGRQVTCTYDHRWLVRRPRRTTGLYEWRHAGKLAPGWQIMTPLDVWPEGDTFEAGWLSGIYDGEGNLHTSSRMNGLALTQVEGPVLDRAKAILAAMGVPFTMSRQARQRSKSGEWRQAVMRLDINARRHVMRVLGELRPIRLLQQRTWEGMQLQSPKYPNNLEIATIEPLGVSEVVSIETTSHTYLANGMVSHNCEDSDISHRIHLAQAQGWAGEWVTAPIDAWITVQGHGVKVAGVKVDYERLYEYHQRKWGGGIGGREVFTHPFDDPTLPLSWWPTPPDPRSTMATAV